MSKIKKIICAALFLTLCGCSFPKDKKQSVANTSGAPIIKVKEATITEGNKLKDSDICSVKKEKGNKYSVSITGFDNNKIGDQKIYVSVSDKNGNMTLRTTNVKVVEKAAPVPTEIPIPTPEPTPSTEPTPEPTPEATPEAKKNQEVQQAPKNNNNNSNSAQKPQKQQPQSQPQQPAQQPVQQPVQQPQSQPTQPQEDTNAGNANTGNPFGGNQASGATYSSYEACRLAKEGTNYSCIPVYGNDGSTVIGYN